MTLASDHTNTRSNDREGIPPTLLRLPDLDPPPAVDSDEISDAGDAEVPPAQIAGGTNVTVVPEAADPTTINDVTEASHPATVNDTFVAEVSPKQPASSPRAAMSAHVDAAVSAASLASRDSGESDTRVSPAGKSFVGPADREESKSPSQRTDSSSAAWLVAFASRKTLLVLVAVLAAVAIFLPRGDDAPSDDDPPLLVDNGNTFANPASSLSIQAPESYHSPDDPAAPYDHEESGAKLRQPIASHGPNRSLLDLSEPDALEPSKSQFASLSPIADAVPDDFPAIEPMDPFDMTIAAPVDATPETGLSPTGTQVSEFPPRFDEEATFAAVGADNESIDPEPAPQLVESRTPNPITDWKKFLPGMQVAESTDSSSTTVIRTSAAPEEPKFEFALPSELSVEASSASESTTIPSNANATGSAPEARVAMPANLSTTPVR